MEQQDQAALETEHNFVIDSDDHTTEQESDETQPTESAPVEQEETQIEPKVEPKASESKGVQARFNQLTAEKYAEKRRADEFERRLQDLESKPKLEAKEPKEEDFDYDDAAFSKANLTYQVQQELQKRDELQQAQTRKQQEQQQLSEFNERITKLGKDDYVEKANALPSFPNGVTDALIQAKNGPEIVYYLGQHLDVADSIANMSPPQAMMELGRISANMSVKKEVKTSAAPEPIETLRSGSVIAKSRGPVGATYT